MVSAAVIAPVTAATMVAATSVGTTAVEAAATSVEASSTTAVETTAATTTVASATVLGEDSRGQTHESERSNTGKKSVHPGGSHISTLHLQWRVTALAGRPPNQSYSFRTPVPGESCTDDLYPRENHG